MSKPRSSKPSPINSDPGPSGRPDLSGKKVLKPAGPEKADVPKPPSDDEIKTTLGSWKADIESIEVKGATSTVTIKHDIVEIQPGGTYRINREKKIGFQDQLNRITKSWKANIDLDE